MLQCPDMSRINRALPLQHHLKGLSSSSLHEGTLAHKQIPGFLNVKACVMMVHVIYVDCCWVMSIV